MHTQSAAKKNAQWVPLVQIIMLFARVGLTSFGGGVSAWIYREVVTERGWLKDEEFLGALTLGQVLPGSNVINVSIYVGYRMRGMVGSVAAVAALLVPPMVVIVLFASVFHRFTQYDVVHRLLEGMAAAAIGMTASVGLRTAKAAIAKQRWPLLLISAVFVAVGVLRWPLVPVAIVAGAMGLLISARTRADA
jgi:chromate transporter